MLKRLDANPKALCIARELEATKHTIGQVGIRLINEKNPEIIDELEDDMYLLELHRNSLRRRLHRTNKVFALKRSILPL